MSWAPKLVALDVDGTLVDFEDEMSDPVRDIVAKAADAGIHVVIATGRAIPGITHAIERLGLSDGIAVASNGSIVFEYPPVDVVHQVTFDASHAVRMLLERVPYAAVAVEDPGVGYRINKPFPEGEINGTMTIQSVEELVAEPVTRVIIRSPDHSAEEFAEMSHLLGLAGTNYYVGYTAWLDITPEGVSKASGLDVVCERLGVDRADVLAIGDGSNDVEMLSWAGRGVAMGNAPLHVQEVADAVTDTVQDDGVVTELSRYL